jgi:phosphatidylinositol alpha-mannosyltransferase
VRIGIVCPYSFDIPGGVQFHVRDLAEILRSAVTPCRCSPSRRGLNCRLRRLGRARRAGELQRLGGAAQLPADDQRQGHCVVGPWSLRSGHIHEPITPSIGALAMGRRLPIVATFHLNLRSRAMQVSYPFLRSAWRSPRADRRRRMPAAP